jgi:drug/metabolite transporter (DMT)-like permease
MDMAASRHGGVDVPTLTRYRPWFLAAALYNVAWGAFVVLSPRAMLEWIGVEPPAVIALWQVVGAMVLAFAPAYWWASRDPWGHRHIILIGLVGKLIGVAGFACAFAAGQLPAAFALITLGNDLAWLPAFGLFAVEVARTTGWRRLLSGA